MFFAKTVLFQFNLIHVSVSCCKGIVLVQDRSDDSKHWWIDVSIEIFIISNALLDSHMSLKSKVGFLNAGFPLALHQKG